ncbi:butyrophilin-like protein 2 isoform X2 [Cynoglossus semilaevis]|uniref:butyrophilin-like protein 2 isoform X2 n=1 Tax=Cynoglossus semilaevis TaxID=244447 RepID=UPI0007DC91A3|nr:T-lymphocyte activation antigen CD80 isoform X2 [Cynoglossus semilaevis]
MTREDPGSDSMGTETVRTWTFSGLLLSLFTVCDVHGEWTTPSTSCFQTLSLSHSLSLSVSPCLRVPTSPSTDQQCVLGVVGRPVSLPCVHLPLVSQFNVSVEWRTVRDQQVVLRSEWTHEGHVHGWSVLAGASLPTDTVRTGNVSLLLSSVPPTEGSVYYSLFVTSEDDRHAVCTVCLTAAASFSQPLLQREEVEHGGATAFRCLTNGGFPEPLIHWRINQSQEPPEGSVWTQTTPLPNSPLYNVSSHMTLNLSTHTSVSCTVHNPSSNQSWTSTIEGVTSGPGVGRASEAMWMFSTVLCVVVGVMVVVGVVYQIHLDRVSKRKKKEFHRYMSTRKQRCRLDEECEKTEMKPEPDETNL